MGSLNDKGVVDYGAGVPLLPFSALGKIKGRLTSYRQNVGQSEVDCVATFNVLASDAAGVDVGETYALWFKQGFSKDKQVFHDRERRNFVMAALGIDPADRTFDADDGENNLASMDLDAIDAVFTVVQSPDSYVDKKTNVRKETTRRTYFPDKPKG